MLSAPIAAFVALAALALHGCGSGPAPPPAAVPYPLKTTGFSKYHDYEGPLNVQGEVWIGEVAENVQTVHASLTGVDPGCTGAQDGTGNKCGIHIHEGTNCAVDTGPHHWQPKDKTDPWIPVTYSDPMGDDNSVSVQDIVVNTEFNSNGLSGRALVVHDVSGDRVACSLLEGVTLPSAPELSVASFQKYFEENPDDETELDVQGTVEVFTEKAGKGSQILKFKLTGADAMCNETADTSVANSCGIHFHTGKNCSENTGGHYFSVSDDPWLKISYRNADSNGVTIPVVTGYESLEDLDGRAVVVHAHSGKRVACGLMSKDTSVSALNDEPPSMSPLVWVSAMIVVATLGGGAWYYQSQRRGYAAQQDDSTELQNAAA